MGLLAELDQTATSDIEGAAQLERWQQEGTKRFREILAEAQKRWDKIHG